MVVKFHEDAAFAPIVRMGAWFDLKLSKKLCYSVYILIRQNSPDSNEKEVKVQVCSDYVLQLLQWF